MPKRGAVLAPVWAGPCSEADNGGVTFSLLSRFLVCRERFRLLVIDGWKPQERFNHRLEYGNMWHLCEEYHAQGQAWEGALRLYAQDLVTKYPHDGQDIDKWYEVCKIQFPLYLSHWSKHDHSRYRTPLLSEEKFRVPYKLPSGRVVYLRGKWDSVDLVRKNVWLQENKTKSRIDQVQIQRQLHLDLQTMLYAIAFTTWQQEDSYGEPIRTPEAVENKLVGVRYNVVRRTEHRLGKHESCKDFAARVGLVIAENPADWFMRWEVTLTPGDVSSFQRRCLDPILENAADDYEWWAFCAKGGADVYDNTLRWNHFRNHQRRHGLAPFGVYNPLLEGTPTDLDDMIHTGSTAGLVQTDDLFPELK